MQGTWRYEPVLLREEHRHVMLAESYERVDLLELKLDYSQTPEAEAGPAWPSLKLVGVEVVGGGGK